MSKIQYVIKEKGLIQFKMCILNVYTVSRLPLKTHGTYHLLIMAITILNSISVIFGVKKPI